MLKCGEYRHVSGHRHCSRAISSEEIRNNPRSSGDGKIFDVFSPVEQFVWVRNDDRQPYQKPKSDEHYGKQSRRKKRRAPRKQREGRKPKRNRGGDRPKRLSGGNPLRNQILRDRKIDHLCGSKGNNTDPKEHVPDSRQPAWSLTTVRNSRPKDNQCSRDQGEFLKKINPTAISDARHREQSKDEIDDAQKDGADSPCGGP